MMNRDGVDWTPFKLAVIAFWTGFILGAVITRNELCNRIEKNNPGKVATEPIKGSGDDR